MQILQICRVVRCLLGGLSSNAELLDAQLSQGVKRTSPHTLHYLCWDMLALAYRTQDLTLLVLTWTTRNTTFHLELLYRVIPIGWSWYNINK